jgi:2-C-methyl-D-erythritol 4-phosphate cytidylyltransferase
MSKFCVIIPAAGESQRFGGEEKKAFAKLDGRPVFLRTLERFVTRPDVCQTILAVAESDMEQVKASYGANLAFMGVHLVVGGKERFQTVVAALEKVSGDADFVAVHDAVRPCVTDDQIDAVFAEAVKSGAAILGCPVTATLKRVGVTKLIEETIPRSDLFEAQTPQVFRKDILQDAHAKADTSTGVTDDAQLLERAGHPVAVVPSDATNLKITTKGDLRLAQAILKSRPVKKIPRLGAFEEAQW